jgi:hypothetical protein
MEIVVLHDDEKLQTNIDFLKTKLNGSYRVLRLAEFESQFPKINPDFVIFFNL